MRMMVKRTTELCNTQRLPESNPPCGLSSLLATAQKLVVATFSRLDHSEAKSEVSKGGARE